MNNIMTLIVGMIGAALFGFAIMYFDNSCTPGKDPAFKIANSLCLAGCC